MEMAGGWAEKSGSRAGPDKVPKGTRVGPKGVRKGPEEVPGRSRVAVQDDVADTEREEWLGGESAAAEMVACMNPPLSVGFVRNGRSSSGTSEIRKSSRVLDFHSSLGGVGRCAGGREERGIVGDVGGFRE